MYAEKLTLRTDAQGQLRGLPDLPPETTVELIVLLPDTAVFPTKPRRRPPPGLKGKIKIRGDIVQPAVAEDEWDALQ